MASQEGNTVAPIKEALRSVTKASDVREDNALLLQPYSNWEQFLMPGPLSIAIIGEIIFLSAGEDFAIDKNMPTEGFKYMKYPKSFRACLVQVSNQGWQAFQEAHKNMDQIRLLAMRVPTDMKDVVKLLMQKDTKITEDFLPISLDSIKSTADMCLQLSTAVEEKFHGVILLINELLEACTKSKGAYEEQLHKIKIKKELYEMKEKAAAKTKAMLEDHYHKLESQVKKAQEDYQASMDDIPVGGEAVLMNMAESIVSGIRSLISGKTFMSLYNLGRKISSNVQPSSHIHVNPNHAEGAEINILYHAENLQNCIQILHSFINGNKINLKKMHSENAKNSISNCRERLKKLQQEATTGVDCKGMNTVLEICNTAIGISEELDKMAQSKKTDKMADLVAEIKLVMQNSFQLSAQCTAEMGSMGLTATPPQMAKAQPVEELSGTASGNARFKVQLSAAQLQAAQERSEKSFENMKENNKEIQEVLEILKSCKVQEIDFDKTVKMLLKGLDALGRVKEQWGKMVLFFTMMSNLIKTSQIRTLYKFVKYSEKISGYSQNQFVQDLLYTQISQATNIASLVHMIAETYTQVSTQHLMERVNSLGTLLGLDPNQDKIKFEQERKKFGSDCNEASQAIGHLVQKNKQQYEKRVQARIDKINSVMALLPPATSEEIKAIEDAVKKGVHQGISDEDVNDFV